MSFTRQDRKRTTRVQLLLVARIGWDRTNEQEDIREEWRGSQGKGRSDRGTRKGMRKPASNHPFYAFYFIVVSLPFFTSSLPPPHHALPSYLSFSVCPPQSPSASHFPTAAGSHQVSSAIAFLRRTDSRHRSRTPGAIACNNLVLLFAISHERARNRTLRFFQPITYVRST